jgi:PAS domain-containing protein
MGFVVFESGSRSGRMYETLRTQFSSALLMQRVRERSAELARRQYILDAFMETVPDYIYFKDLESRITRANKAHANKMGLTGPDEEIGESDFDFFPQEQARIKHEHEQEIIRTGQPILNLEEPGGIIGTFGISRDITA